MSYFFWLTITLFFLTAIFYIVFFGFLYYWHEKKATFVIVPLIFTFEFFVTGFFIVAVIAIVLQYIPDIIKVFT